MRIPAWFITVAVLAAAGLPIEAQSLTEARYPYKKIGDRELEVIVYSPGSVLPGEADALRPAIILIHGGGWRGGQPEILSWAARELAGRGAVCIAVQYRLAGSNGATIQDCLDDVRDSVRWVRQEAPRLGINPNRLALLGESAGGHLAAAVVMLQSRVDVSALVLLNPVLDLEPPRWSLRIPGVTQENARAWSPLRFVREGLPPVLIVHGTDDSVVPITQSRQFAADLQAAGNRAKLLELDHVEHAFFSPGYGKEEVRLRVLQDICGFLSGEKLLPSRANPDKSW
jgi:acetyl esterase